MTVSNKTNIGEIADNAICTACGACAGMCPEGAIQMTYNEAGYLVASVLSAKCRHCGVCRRVCPSVAANKVAVDALDPFRGSYINAYIGHSSDANIRLNGQSGGIVTSLLCCLLDQGEIDGAVVNRFSSRAQRNEAFFAKTKEELLNATGSYYCQSPVVKTVCEHKHEKMAAVLLGCQSESVSLIRKIAPGFPAPEYCIGLICVGQFSGCFIDNLVDLVGTDRDKVRGFRFKDKNHGGWPGDVTVDAGDHGYVLDKRIRNKLKPLYEAYRCMLCFDQMNVHSDIVAGDPWGIKHEENKEGNTIIITRTAKGQRLLDAAEARGYIEVSKVSVEDVFKGQTIDNRLKTQFFSAMQECREKGCLLPVNDRDFESISSVIPSRKQSRSIRERIAYTRTIYQAASKSQVDALRDSRNQLLKRRERRSMIALAVKRFAKRLLRKR